MYVASNHCRYIWLIDFLALSQRILLPRISQSLGARNKLQLYQTELLGRLKARMDQVKKTQEELYDTFVPSSPETPPAGIKSLAELPVDTEGQPTHSLGVVIRCAFLEKPDQRLTTEDLCNRLSTQFPGLRRNKPEFQVRDTFFLPFHFF